MKIFPSEITSYSTYLNRRTFIKGILASSLTVANSNSSLAYHESNKENLLNQLDETDALNTYEEITNYNNYYEFGTGKKDPALRSNNFKPVPWSVKIEGLIKKA